MSEVSQEQGNLDQNPTDQARQDENTLAVINGVAVTELPQDLYIPPEALEVFLETFEGPLDLLLYFIKKQNIDILDISIAEITRQYMEYVDIMKELQLDLAAEYLVMAAMLAEIKSRMLLPRAVNEDGEEEDPRAELIRRLQEYERYKNAAEDLDSIPRRERDTFPASAKFISEKEVVVQPDIQFDELMEALRRVLQQAELRTHHMVQRETLSLRERMSIVLDKVKGKEFVPFVEFFNLEEGRSGVVVSFIAVLELLKGGMIEIVQSELFGSIHVRAKLV